jgi:hypothetical protein
MADCPTPQFRMDSFDIDKVQISWHHHNSEWSIDMAGHFYGQYTCNDDEGETSKCTQGDSKGRCELLPAAKELKVYWQSSYIEKSMINEIIDYLDPATDGFSKRLRELSKNLKANVDKEIKGEKHWDSNAVILVESVEKKINDAIWWANEGFPGNMLNGYDYKCLCITERKLATDINLSHYHDENNNIAIEYSPEEEFRIQYQFAQAWEKIKIMKIVENSDRRAN